jgi:hypothetical protein
MADSQWSLTNMAFRHALEMTGKWIARVQKIPVQHRAKWIYRRYWKKQNNKSGIRVLK